MPFTATELANVSNALLDFHVRGDAMSQVLQDRPLFKKMMGAQKTFPGGKELITYPVKGQYTTQIQGYSHDDQVGYSNPANIRRASAKWYEVHAGISLTLTELKMAGISMSDTENWGSPSNHSEAEKIVLTNLLTDKIDDMLEGFGRSFNTMLWADGTQDPKAVPGLRSFLLDSPTVGTSFGLDRAQNTWWRNRSSLGIDSSTASNQNLINTLQKEFRQLRRFGGRADMILAGSDFMDAMEKELRSKGNYTQEGWSSSKKIDASMADLQFKGVDIVYDPTLDDMSLSKYAYVIDSRHVKLWVMDGEDRKIHTPARPPEKYVLFRSITWTGAMCADQLNAHGVYSIA